MPRYIPRVPTRCENHQYSLRWRHNDHAGVSNHQPHSCLLNRLFRRKSKKISKLRVTGLCAGNSPGTGEFPAQMASYAENVSIWWRHHVAGGIWLSKSLEIPWIIWHSVAWATKYYLKLLMDYDGNMSERRVITVVAIDGHDDVIKWKHFSRYWPFVREITGPRWIPRTKGSDAELWCLLSSAPE